MPITFPYAVSPISGSVAFAARTGAPRPAFRTSSATPQSITFTTPNGAIITFSGLRSRCSTPRLCA